MYYFRIFLACLSFVLAVVLIQLGSLFAQAPAKLPIPDTASKKKASAEIKEIYGGELSKAKTAAKKIELAEKLFQVGIDSKNDPSNRYVLFRISKDIAAGAGDADTAFQAIDQLDKFYKIDAFAMKYDTLIKTAKYAKTKDASKIIVEKATLLMEDCVKRNKYDLAKELGKVSLAAARKVKDLDSAKEMVARNKEIATIAQEYEKVKTAFATLETKPYDSTANMEVGKFYCLAKGDWQKGLAMLALGSDATLKSLAVKELQGPKAADFLVLGNGWWEQSAKAEGLAQKQLKAHAAIWYRKALPSLSGLGKVKVERRLEQVPKISSIVTIPTKGLISHWSFDKGSANVARDSVGNNHGKISGARWGKGVKGGALSFDGIDDYVLIPTIKMANSSFTFSTWVKRSKIGQGYLLGQVGWTKKANQNLQVGFASDDSFKFDFYYDGLSAQRVPASSDTSNWHHWVVTYDLSTNRQTIFLNGKPLASRNATTGPHNRNSNLLLGRLGDGRYFKGMMDDVYIYNRALTAGEVMQLAGSIKKANSGFSKTDTFYLDDLQETDSRTGYGSLGKHGSTGYPSDSEQRFIFRGVQPRHCLSIHATSRGSSYITYKLKGRYEMFEAIAALRDTHSRELILASSPVMFKVFGDGKLLFKSPVMQTLGKGLSFKVKIKGVNVLGLQVDCSGENVGACHTAWINPRVITSQPVQKNLVEKQVAARHPATAVQFQGHWYMLYSGKASWRTADQLCRRLGGKLVCIETAAEAQFVTRIAKGNQTLLGGFKNDRGQWMLVNGKPMTYNNWERGQPSGMGEKYLELQSNGTWNDVSKNQQRGYICEWEK